MFCLFFSALEITGENLEDLLAYDDLFLDYFNAFLQLPVFPQPLWYNRLTGDFEDVRRHNNRSVDGSVSGTQEGMDPLPYGPTDEERDNLLEWARQERLPLFLSTQLFRELKLCKLLLRPLDDRYSASRGSSRQIRGYSRQSESYVSSLSNSADNSAHDEIDDDDSAFMQGHIKHSDLFKYQRPGSRAVSVPTRFDFPHDFLIRGSTETNTQDSMSRIQTKSASHKKKIREVSMQDTEDSKPRKQSIVKFDPTTSETKSRKSSRLSRERRLAQKSEAEQAFLRHSRALSAPLNYDDYMRHPNFGDFEFLFGGEEPDADGHVYIRFPDEGLSEEQTETDVKNMEGRLKMSLQQLKEQVLGTHEGMEGFKEFLKGTAGNQLINFWLDCEYYKDAMENFDEIINMDIRNRLFRDIQDKYKMNLTEDARNQITKASSNSTLSHTVFIRTQYDVLRRLRAYWVPRYLIHQERLRELSAIEGVEDIRLLASQNAHRHVVPFLPSISLVNSLPVKPDDVLTYTRTKNWDFISKGGRKLDSRISSAKLKPGIVPPTPIRITKDRFLIALTTDKMAGGPFQRFLEKLEDRSLLSSLLFWEDVTDYGKEEDRSADRLLRLCHAWNIYNQYFSPKCANSIDVSEPERILLHQTLMNAKDFVEAHIFHKAKVHIIGRLERAWVQYLKQDLKLLLDAHVRDRSVSPPSTADVIDITVTNEDLVIMRPDPWVKRVPTTESQREARIKASKSVEMSPEKRAEMRALARQRRKEMERERKKAIRAAYRRVREAKQKKDPDKEDEEDMEFDIDGEKRPSKPPPPFTDMIHNKQIMTNYKKHLLESEDKERLNMVSLYNDIENYLNLGNSKSDTKKKDSQAHFIYKTYYDGQGKKHMMFSDKIKGKISDRPKTAVLKDMQNYIVPRIEESFKIYLTEKAAENGMDPREFAGLSQAELSLRMGTDAGLMGTWKKGRKGKTGRAQPTKEDKTEFLEALRKSAAGHLTLPMLYFYKYLLKHGEEDGSPLIDKDLFFYIEVQKFKDANHAYSDDELLRKKVQAIMECFLESVTSPTLQIDVTAQLHEKTLRGAQRYLAGKDIIASIFDEAQLGVFKELLPYWAGFKRTFQQPEDPNKRPVTKYQKMLRKRLDMIENYEVPESEFNFPSIPEGSIAAYTFSCLTACAGE
ncbi:hypothetical protein FSP39_021520 [Pinctada imbricata]|uniref:RGS domain-containing protein n=1 Tax=Pinctada imbricata TaxID=66713 RepID=A0AA88XXV3_PINIB|nr:hypothetical protein FSP39_021520 [Pinctada imbricata]